MRAPWASSPLGDAALTVAGLAEPGRAGADDLALAMSPRYADGAEPGQGAGGGGLAGRRLAGDGSARGGRVGRARLAMADLTRAFDRGPGWADGRHPTALIEAGAELGEGVSVGAYSVIGAGAGSAPAAASAPHVTIAAGVEIGAGR